MLECAGAELLIQRITDVESAEPRRLAQVFEDRVENGTLVEIEEANHAFHRALIGFYGNSVLAELVNDLRDTIRPTVRTPWSTHNGMRQSSTEHYEMLDAIDARNVPKLKKVLHKHMFKWT